MNLDKVSFKTFFEPMDDRARNDFVNRTKSVSQPKSLRGKDLTLKNSFWYSMRDLFWTQSDFGTHLQASGKGILVNH